MVVAGSFAGWSPKRAWGSAGAEHGWGYGGRVRAVRACECAQRSRWRKQSSSFQGFAPPMMQGERRNLGCFSTPVTLG